MKRQNSLYLIFILGVQLGLQGCFFKLAGTGGGDSAAQKGINYNSSYIGYLSVVKSENFEDWHAQTRFFEHFGASDNQGKREINENNFESKIKIINSNDDYNVQVIFKSDEKDSNIVLANFRRGDRGGDLIDYTQKLFSKDVNIKRANIKSLNNFNLKHAPDWKIFVSSDGNEIEGYRTGNLSSAEESSKSVVRFRVYLDRYKVAALPSKEDEQKEDEENEEDGNGYDAQSVEQEVVN